MGLVMSHPWKCPRKAGRDLEHPGTGEGGTGWALTFLPTKPSGILWNCCVHPSPPKNSERKRGRMKHDEESSHSGLFFHSAKYVWKPKNSFKSHSLPLWSPGNSSESHTSRSGKAFLTNWPRNCRAAGLKIKILQISHSCRRCTERIRLAAARWMKNYTLKNAERDNQKLPGRT